MGQRLGGGIGKLEHHVPGTFDGVGAIFHPQFEHRRAVEGLFEDAFYPGVVDKLEHQVAVAEVGGGGGRGVEVDAAFDVGLVADDADLAVGGGGWFGGFGFSIGHWSSVRVLRRRVRGVWLRLARASMGRRIIRGSARSRRGQGRVGQGVCE